jgi:hypothetical protein
MQLADEALPLGQGDSVLAQSFFERSLCLFAPMGRDDKRF